MKARLRPGAAELEVCSYSSPELTDAIGRRPLLVPARPLAALSGAWGAAPA